MKEYKSKRNILIIVCMVAVLFVISISFIIYKNFNSFLYMVNPELYVKNAFLQTVEEGKVPVKPLFEEETVTKFRFKIKSIAVNNKQKKALISATCGINFNPNRKDSVYGIETYVGVGGIKMYKADVYVDRMEVICSLPKSNDKRYGITWEEIKQYLDTDVDLFEYVDNEYDNFVNDIKIALKTADIELIDKKERAFRLKMKDKDNPLPMDSFVVYVNDEHKVYKIESEHVSIILDGDDNIWEKGTVSIERENLGVLYINYDASFNTKGDFKATINDLTVVVSGFNQEVRTNFTGSYGYDTTDYVLPIKPE